MKKQPYTYVDTHVHLSNVVGDVALDVTVNVTDADSPDVTILTDMKHVLVAEDPQPFDMELNGTTQVATDPLSSPPS